MGLDPPYLPDRAAELDRFDKYLAVIENDEEVMPGLAAAS